MRSVALRAFWSLTSSLTSVAVGLVALFAAYRLYWTAWERIGLSDIQRKMDIPNQLSGWETVIFEVTFWCLVLGAAAQIAALSLWLSQRLGGWTPGTVACTLFLIGLVALPVLLFASSVNCIFIEGFPLPMYSCAG